MQTVADLRNCLHLVAAVGVVVVGMIVAGIQNFAQLCTVEIVAQSVVVQTEDRGCHLAGLQTALVKFGKNCLVAEAAPVAIGII